MAELPRNYSDYLSKLEPHLAEAIRPVFQQSAADGHHGVEVIFSPDQSHAMVRDDLAFGKIREKRE